ncbi:MAG: alkaline phosphatase family protein [Lewinella sp.]|nr:alkaline phosphatase family protein [Lewinella sp.]
MRSLNTFLISAVFLFAGIVSRANAQTGKDVLLVEHVIVIGVDGMSPDGIQQAPTPNIDFLVQNGAATFQARGVLPSSSSPNWASMIMGAGPEQHGVTSNAWEKDDFVLPGSAADADGYFPSIFNLIHDQRPGAKSAAIYHWDGFGRLFNSKIVDLSITLDTEDATTKKAVNYLQEQQPLFCFVHLDHVDHAGHHDGHGSPEYYRAVSKADSLIGVIMDGIRASGIMDETLVILSADHGGVGLGHGGETPEEVLIPFILYGKGIKEGYSIRGAVNTMDNAATVAFALGLEIPNAWIGRPVKEAFVGHAAPKITYPVPVLVSKPVIHPEKMGFEQAGGLYIDEYPELKIDNPNETGIIRYTLDGSTPDTSSPVFENAVTLQKNAVVKAAIFSGDKKISKEATGYFRVLRSDPQKGVRYHTYLVPDIKTLPDFGPLQEVSQAITHEISLDEVQLPEQEQVAAVFDTYLQVATAGEYQFYLASDDGSKLWVNDQLVVDNDGDHGVIERSGTVNLPAGKQKLRVEWFNGGGGMGLYLFYKGPGISKQLIPAGELYLSKD